MISVTASVVGEQVMISVQNPGQLDTTAAEGVGTGDARQRLELLFGRKARFSLSQIDPETVSAEVSVPLPEFFNHLHFLPTA